MSSDECLLVDKRAGYNGTDEAYLILRLLENLASDTFVEAKAQRWPTITPVSPIVAPNVVVKRTVRARQPQLVSCPVYAAQPATRVDVAPAAS